jgi:tetratricopeptide (TPR) repeat protein
MDDAEGRRTAMTVRTLTGALALACLGAIGACRPSEKVAQAPATDASVLTPPDRSGLRSVTLPDFTKMGASAQAQLRAQASALRSKLADATTPRADLGKAYGEMGQLLLATTDLDAAEPCFINAQTLAPSDSRWPYYLGQLYKIKGPLENAVASFERALQLQPTDVATLVWLGDAYLSQGRADAAAPLFAKALTVDPKSAAAHYGAGRAALAGKDYVRAVKELEEALLLEPRANASHYPLAMAYRGLGNVAQAQAHLALQGDLQARPPDPLMQQLDGLLQSAEAYNVRGGRELDAGNWAAAAENFRKGLDLSPNDSSLRHRLGTALYQMGDRAGAAEQFEQVLRTSPRFARAHFSLGLLLLESGRYNEAVQRFRSALEYEPGYVQARVQLAVAASRSGRPQEALDEFEKALEADPTLVDAAFDRAMTLVRLHRYQEARDRLTELLTAHPDQPKFANALARLLAAAPDDKVRDGRRAKVIVDSLLKAGPSIELVETAAMMLAELGRYAEASDAQRSVIAAAEQQRLPAVVARLTENLHQYERREPCRRPFADAELP